MKILVTGADGMLGQDLCPALEDEGFEVVETTRIELDVIDEKACLEVISAEKPDFVIHCAAYTDVEKSEVEFEKALLVNENGAKHVAKACAKTDCAMIYISTDYVFDGNKNKPYKTTDKPNPINKYGLSKLKGEEAVKKFCPKHYIVRTSWLYGHHGKNFVETMIALSDREKIKVVNDQTGSPTWTMELVNGIIELIEEEKPFGIYHICGGGETSWADFAKEIFKHTGAKTKVMPVSSEEHKTLAKRPKYSTMENDGVRRNWKSALKDYIELRCE